MLLNNIYESFNAVIKHARDKPIISCLEWIRRYVLKRNGEKWDGIQDYGGRFMPYVDKVFSWVKEEAKNCNVLPGRMGEFEVNHDCSRFIVDITKRTCSCYKWDLTRIPCPHAYASIMQKMLKLEDFVDSYYSRDMYLQAYGPYIKVMPGMEQWEATDMPHPLPPPIRKLPGRPSKRKRKPEPGEATTAKEMKKPRRNACSNCKEIGHNKNKCKKPTTPAPPQKNQGGRPPTMSPWSIAQRAKKAVRVARKTMDAAYVANPQMEYDAGPSSPPPQPSQTTTPTIIQTEQYCQWNNIPFTGVESSQASSALPTMNNTPSSQISRVQPKSNKGKLKRAGKKA